MTSGLAQNRDTTVSFLGEGVEPEADAKFHRQLSIVAGEGLGSGEPFGVLLGKGLAERVHARPGDYLTLLSQTTDGALNTMNCHEVFFLLMPYPAPCVARGCTAPASHGSSERHLDTGRQAIEA